MCCGVVCCVVMLCEAVVCEAVVCEAVVCEGSFVGTVGTRTRTRSCSCSCLGSGGVQWSSVDAMNRLVSDVVCECNAMQRNATVWNVT